MKKKFTVWSMSKDSNRIKAFKSALSLRRKESWLWVDAADQADLWVLDDDVSIDNQVDAYNTMANKPTVAIITSEECAATTLCNHPEQWHHVNTPISVNLIFKWLDTTFLSQQTDRPLSDATPWLTHNFKLSAWPDVSKYGSNSNIVLICSKLLNGYHSYQSVLSWGVDTQTLDQILADAYRHSIIDIQPGVDPVKNMSDHSEQPDKNKSLIQKLLGRFI